MSIEHRQVRWSGLVCVKPRRRYDVLRQRLLCQGGLDQPGASAPDKRCRAVSRYEHDRYADVYHGLGRARRASNPATPRRDRDWFKLARPPGVILGVNHHLPSAPTVRAIRAAIANSLIGVPLSAQVAIAGSLPETVWTWRLGSVGGGCDPRPDLHSDLRRFVLDDEVTDCSALADREGLARHDAGDAVIDVLRFSSSMLATVQGALTLPFEQTGVDIQAQRQASWLATL